MTNDQIIADIAASIYGEDAVSNMINNGKEIPLHTVKGWAARGPYRVKRGEHGIETRLWKKKTNKDMNLTEEEKGNADELYNQSFYMAKAFLFREDQVEKAEE